MNAAGYIFAAIVALAFCYLILVPRWGRRRGGGYQPKWGRQHKIGKYTVDYSKVTAKQLAQIPSEHDALLARSRVVSRRTDLRPTSAERMRSVRHETRKPRAPVRAVPKTAPVAVDTPSDISTLLTIGLLNTTSAPDCAPSDAGSGSSDSGGGCNSGGSGGGD